MGSLEDRIARLEGALARSLAEPLIITVVWVGPDGELREPQTAKVGGITYRRSPGESLDAFEARLPHPPGGVMVLGWC